MRGAALRYNNMAIFYIPHDPTLTYLMRNSKQHRVLSPAVAVAWLGLYLAQSRHVLRAPNDVFICHHILLRTHYTGPSQLGLSAGNIILTQCFGSWLWSLWLVRAVNPDTDIGDEESLETQQTSPTGVWSRPHKYMQPEERGDKTDKKSEIPCLTLSEWPSRENLDT